MNKPLDESNQSCNSPALTIDARSLLHATPDICRAISDACINEGFLLLNNCFHDSDRLYELMCHMDRFFELPDDDPVKQSVHVSRSSHKYGWTPVLGEPAYEPGTIAFVESFDCGVGGVEQSVWPSIPGFRQTVRQYWDHIFLLGDLLLTAMATGLGLAPRLFADQCGSQTLNTLRLLHYPTNTQPDNDVNMGISAHTDFECMTLIYQTDPGLEIFDSTRGWFEAPFGKGQVVVLLGDMLERWTNGEIRATPHRVRNKHFGRKSIVLFIAVDPDRVVKPLAAFVEPGRPVSFEPVTQRRHLEAEIERAQANAAAVQSS